MKKILLSIMSLVMLTFVSCNNISKYSSEEGIGEITTSDTGVSETTVAETEYISEHKNPLTGLRGYNENAVGKRPVAIMVNNIKDSLPQYGIELADIIYEIPVEGGITRMMAIYADYTNVPDVCSVRSCRYYYPIISYGMDAIYCHWGRDTTIADETLKRLKIDNLDGAGGAYGTLYFRDEVREETFSSEHTGYLKGEAMAEVIEDFGYRTDLLEKNSSPIFKFNSEGNPIDPQGAVCMSANLPFSESYYSTFEYNSVTNTYKKYHSGNPHIDSATGNQIDFTNIFALYTDISLRGVGALVDVELTGGDGYYISNGSAQQIKWHKKSEDDPIRFTDLNGAEISVNAGKSYIGILNKTSYIEID